MEQLASFFNKFHRLSAEEFHEIELISKIVEVKKGKELQPIGKTCRTIYFIRKGIARIFYYKDGVDITESFSLENQMIVRVESLFTGEPSKKGIQVLEDTEIIAIDATKLFGLYDRYHAIERLFRIIFESSFVDTVNRLESLQFHSADERYRHLILESPDILQRVPLKYIASYLGITQVSLSRIRAQMII